MISMFRSIPKAFVHHKQLWLTNSSIVVGIHLSGHLNNLFIWLRWGHVHLHTQFTEKGHEFMLFKESCEIRIVSGKDTLYLITKILIGIITVVHLLITRLLIEARLVKTWWRRGIHSIPLLAIPWLSIPWLAISLLAISLLAIPLLAITVFWLRWEIRVMIGLFKMMAVSTWWRWWRRWTAAASYHLDIILIYIIKWFHDRNWRIQWHVETMPECTSDYPFHKLFFRLPFQHLIWSNWLFDVCWRVTLTLFDTDWYVPFMILYTVDLP